MVFVAQRSPYQPAQAAGRCLQGASIPTERLSEESQALEHSCIFRYDVIWSWLAYPYKCTQTKKHFMWSCLKHLSYTEEWGFRLKFSQRFALVNFNWVSSSLSLVRWYDQHCTGVGYTALGGKSLGTELPLSVGYCTTGSLSIVMKRRKGMLQPHLQQQLSFKK